ncbi:MAG: MMPL family transporter [Alphaproteobacteria bacterium]|nr:MMPL family transporter [Alphaproteobacteria bacterium]
MLAPLLVSVVDFSRRFAKSLVVGALLLSLALGVYVARNISINTDINQLLSENLGWRKREKGLEAAFPQKVDNLVIVIDGATGDKAEAAADALANKLAAMPDKFTFVSRPDALPFFRANGLLYLSTKELGDTLDQIAQAQPMLGTVISDPSLRGLMGTLGMMMQGVQAGATNPAQIKQPLEEITAAFQAAAEGKEHPLDWQKMMPAPATSPNTSRELRKYIITKPVLDYAALQPGEAAEKIVRQTAAELGLTPANGVRFRLTGPVPLNDQEFASVAEGTGLATVLSALLVLGLLFLAMRTWRIVLPIALTLGAGLVTSTAFATFAVGSLNLISVAFAVMFIGIAVDFGIQFGVRYRDQHHLEPDHAKALRHTAAVIAAPLAMAAASTALGFLSFIPTDYRGVSELGIIAGSSMIIAFVLNITLLPALMTLTKPPAEAEGVGYAALAPLNNFLLTRRKILIPVILAVTAAGLISAMHLRFDFDPLDLKNPNAESVQTMFEAMQDPDSDAYAAQILQPSPQAAQQLADKLSQLPEVDHVMTLDSFIPEDQDKKLAMIADTAALLAPTFALPRQPAASDEDNLDALRKTAALLHQAGDKMPEALALADALDKLASEGSHAALERAQANVIAPLQAKLEEIRGVMQAKPVTLDDIPPELKRDWVAKDGKWLVEIFPKRGVNDNPRDPKMLDRFVKAVRTIAPDISGTPVSILESGRTVASAFIHAGIYGFAAIALLSLVVLRRARDVAKMMTPLLIAGILTLGTIAALNMPLNYANIIALPLLLSLGTSYAVYFVFYAKNNRRDFLQSSMSRAVLFSAATVLAAFASLCFSSHPGTRSMGELLTIALLYSLLCTFLVLPMLYGFKKKATLHEPH